MSLSKRGTLKFAAILLPFICVAAYAAGLPLALPAFLLPARSYLALSAEAGPEGLKALRPQRGKAFLVLPDRILPLPQSGASTGQYEKLAALLPDRPRLEPLVREIERGSKGLARLRLVTDFVPWEDELSALREAAAKAGLPIKLDCPEEPPRSPLLAIHYIKAATDKRAAFDLLLSPESRSASRLVVSARGQDGQALSLWSGTGVELPGDRVLRLSADREGLSEIELRSEGSQGAAVRRLDLGAELDEKPRVLVLSEKAGRKSFIESIYPTERKSLAEAEGLDFHAYELVVVDGLPLKGLRGRVGSGLASLAARRTGSLLFAADSPDFGAAGDNPEIEALLPVSLMPRSLKDLPDLALLLMIDTSGSMFGDKLSLAKVTGLELLRSLKPTDLVGMLLFSDDRAWAYDFTVNQDIVAAPVLEPLSAGGGTDLAPALREGLERLALQPMKEKHVVLISDGVTKPADFKAIAERARVIGATISTMGIGEDLDRALLERLALQAGGRFYRVSSAEEIPSLLFEDRKSASRPPFSQGRIPVLAITGDRVATIGGMAQYAAAPPATVLFTNELGDPLFASRESGNRAVMVFASDLYGGYTADFFSRETTAGAIKNRLDALFSEKPLELSVSETARGLYLMLRSESLAAPRLLLSRAGTEGLEAPFRSEGPGLWSVRISPPWAGHWTASILDRGSAVAAFPLAANRGLGGVEAQDLLAAEAWKPAFFRLIRSDAVWLGLLLAASLFASVVLRVLR